MVPFQWRTWLSCFLAHWATPVGTFWSGHLSEYCRDNLVLLNAINKGSKGFFFLLHNLHFGLGTQLLSLQPSQPVNFKTQHMAETSGRGQTVQIRSHFVSLPVFSGSYRKKKPAGFSEDTLFSFTQCWSGLENGWSHFSIVVIACESGSGGVPHRLSRLHQRQQTIHQPGGRFNSLRQPELVGGEGVSSALLEVYGSFLLCRCECQPGSG